MWRINLCKSVCTDWGTIWGGEWGRPRHWCISPHPQRQREVLGFSLDRWRVCGPLVLMAFLSSFKIEIIFNS